jgi:hypothetical protein
VIGFVVTAYSRPFRERVLNYRGRMDEIIQYFHHKRPLSLSLAVISDEFM